MQKIALITGATGGLGQAIAKKLLEDNWNLILVSRNLEKLQAAYRDGHTQIIADCSHSAGVKHIF